MRHMYMQSQRQGAIYPQLSFEFLVPLCYLEPFKQILRSPEGAAVGDPRRSSLQRRWQGSVQPGDPGVLIHENRKYPELR